MKKQSIIPSLQQIVNFLQEETINQIAKETGFSVRKRKLSAIVFCGESGCRKPASGVGELTTAFRGMFGSLTNDEASYGSPSD